MDEKLPTTEPREKAPEIVELIEAQGSLPTGAPDENDEPQRPETD